MGTIVSQHRLVAHLYALVVGLVPVDGSGVDDIKLVGFAFGIQRHTVLRCSGMTEHFHSRAEYPDVGAGIVVVCNGCLQGVFKGGILTIFFHNGVGHAKLIEHPAAACACHKTSYARGGICRGDPGFVIGPVCVRHQLSHGGAVIAHQRFLAAVRIA